MGRITAWMDRAWYGDQGDNWDNEIFRSRILRELREEHAALDLGAGAGYVAQMNFRGLAGRLCGVDPSDDVKGNPYLDEAEVGGAEAIPYPDATFDLVFSNNVFEHLEDPGSALTEIHRVLKPGGVLCMKTPNFSHYVAILAALTPHSFHRWLNAARGRPERHTFPTYYRANSGRAVRRLAAAAGFEVEELLRIEGRPEYLRIHPATYVLGYLYERAVNSTRLLEGLRSVIIAVLRKPGLDDSSR